ncbi:hypothetical protein L0U88_14665 [Flavihumibacter sp. RY-1]|uniref:Lipocalin-like protein n=1 Tax=Flavihumibacter fluminis TaxID=2909236 RepID=A0ABS9BKX3_9BACT|nr:hypothetical protein [Flavihumibacter fluminis]MCF1715879.1 hypothetical protein [Flavihumibacter fluminis]
MYKLFLTGSLAALITGFTACSPRPVGNWNVQRFEVIKQGESGLIISNVGSMEFNRNGTGEKDIQYSILGITKFDNQPFEWVRHGNTVTISGNNTDFAKSWIIVRDKRHFQQWKSTDGANTIQIIELAR